MPMGAMGMYAGATVLRHLEPPIVHAALIIAPASEQYLLNLAALRPCQCLVEAIK